MLPLASLRQSGVLVVWQFAQTGCGRSSCETDLRFLPRVRPVFWIFGFRVAALIAVDAKFKSLDEEHLSQTGPCPLSRLHDVSRNTISHFEQRVRDFLRGEMDAGMKGRGGRERKNKEGKKPKKKT